MDIKNINLNIDLTPSKGRERMSTPRAVKTKPQKKSYSHHYKVSGIKLRIQD